MRGANGRCAGCPRVDCNYGVQVNILSILPTFFICGDVERRRLMAEKIRQLVEVQLPVLGPVEGAAGVAGVALKMPSSQRNLASSRL